MNYAATAGQNCLNCERCLCSGTSFLFARTPEEDIRNRETPQTCSIHSVLCCAVAGPFKHLLWLSVQTNDPFCCTLEWLFLLHSRHMLLNMCGPSLRNGPKQSRAFTMLTAMRTQSWRVSTKHSSSKAARCSSTVQNNFALT